VAYYWGLEGPGFNPYHNQATFARINLIKKS